MLDIDRFQFWLSVIWINDVFQLFLTSFVSSNRQWMILLSGTMRFQLSRDYISLEPSSQQLLVHWTSSHHFHSISISTSLFSRDKYVLKSIDFVINWFWICAWCYRYGAYWPISYSLVYLVSIFCFICTLCMLSSCLRQNISFCLIIDYIAFDIVDYWKRDPFVVVLLISFTCCFWVLRLWLYVWWHVWGYSTNVTL